MELKIISDGTAVGTQVVDSETGKPVSFVQYVEWSVDAEKGIAEAVLKVSKIEVDLTVKKEDTEIVERKIDADL